jgi:hypothetical protein
MAVEAARLRPGTADPPRPRPNTPWALSPSRTVDIIIKGAELPIPEELRLQSVQYSDAVRSHLKHGGTLDTLVMPDQKIARFVLQTDPTKDVYREVVLPPGVRPKNGDEGEGGGADGTAPELQSPRPNRAARHRGSGKKDAQEHARAMADSRAHRVLMFYELQVGVPAMWRLGQAFSSRGMPTTMTTVMTSATCAPVVSAMCRPS